MGQSIDTSPGKKQKVTCKAFQQQGMGWCFTKLPIALGEFSLQMACKLGFGCEKARGSLAVPFL